jgi:Leucine-rich repeat (LRR) protein
VEQLKDLSNLKIVDLSNNEIEDIRPLLLLENLEFLNIEGNPVADHKVFEELEKRCVVIH